jgi:cysteine-rich repeat protein
MQRLRSGRALEGPLLSIALLATGCVGGVRLEGLGDGGETAPEVLDAPEAEVEAVEDGRDVPDDGDVREDVRDDAAPEHAADADPDDGDAEVSTVCGDGALDPDEECDDGNIIPGDGCEADCRFSCHSVEECTDGNPCTDDACGPAGAGRACLYPSFADGTPCDDGLFCRGADVCRHGICTGTIESCLPCQTCDETLRTCTLIAGACLIDGTCRDESERNPVADCQTCVPERSATEWTVLTDFSPCTLVTSPDRSYDICVEGACVSPGCGDVSCNPPGPHFPLADTNQRGCFGFTPVACLSDPDGTPCAADGSPLFCGQDAQYGWDPIHTAFERFARDTTTAGEPTVRDEVTGLEWQGCPEGLHGDTCNEGEIEASLAGEAVELCDALVWAGRDDWRLPDVYELHSILDLGISGPSIDLGAFPGTPPVSFWSISILSIHPLNWPVDFDRGLVGYVYEGDRFAARCVRGGEPLAVDERFERIEPIADEPIVLDHVTGLTWQGCAVGMDGGECENGEPLRYRWYDALTQCEALSWAGFTDWRMPNVMELSSIVDTRLSWPAVPTALFPRPPTDQTWSSTTYTYNPEAARIVQLNQIGEPTTLTKSSSWGAALCVRDGS